MLEEEIESLMIDFARQNRVFINEAHFQYEFAIALNKAMKGKGYSFTLEYCPHYRKYRVDLLVRSSDSGYNAVIEFKYITTKYKANVDGLIVNLKSQGAQDVRRYASWRDIEKMEQLKQNKGVTEGFFILLTNDITMIEPVPAANIDSSFDISRGIHPASNKLYWNDANSHPKTIERYPNPIFIDGRYEFKYQKYANGLFNYVIVKI